ncbi:MAG: tRNA (N(6)-L-threonylcarbamoyladenosine(37)-C(2))-methylthiotransferase MtaB [Clostridia bacterium]|nr:tRNA (N(6)-L-threonylcarbamoyladenosine(37)-C(2))-methylthiotransferase MtaB [Clostridia bacterium]MBR5044405.1 tRNA (N(6)-L-threonylcarbamoyladenosine(37)-C(2))-methylthiotransferase MtaB [Clostridia bacterium]
MPYRVGFCSLGCKVSQYETEALAERFSAAGFVVSDFAGVCDVYVVNTCAVTVESDRKSRQMIRRAVRENPDAVVIVTGCSSQLHPDGIAAIPGVSYVVGNDRKMHLPNVALDLLSRPKTRAVQDVRDLAGVPFEPISITRAPRTRAFVKIEDGCNCRCAYCAIPLARGPVRSKKPDDVIREVRDLVASGTCEIVLTGIETAAYGIDLDGYRLTDLIADLADKTGVERIRLSSLSPEMMTPGVIKRLAAIPQLAPHFHLSLQSGSDPVLSAMRRPYRTKQVREAMAALRSAIPGVTFTTDVIVGFPGETEENFSETVAFCREARFLRLHVFPYSPRPGTPAATFPGQIPGEEKHRRVKELVKTGREVAGRLLSDLIAAKTPLSVLFETGDGEYFTGHSENYIEVRVKTDLDLAGKIKTVLPTALSGDGVTGIIAE